MQSNIGRCLEQYRLRCRAILLALLSFIVRLSLADVWLPLLLMGGWGGKNNIAMFAVTIYSLGLPPQGLQELCSSVPPKSKTV